MFELTPFQSKILGSVMAICTHKQPYFCNMALKNTYARIITMHRSFNTEPGGFMQWVIIE